MSDNSTMVDNSTMTGDGPSASDIFGSTVDSHVNVMAYIWGPGINIAIILALYSYRRYASILHGMMGAGACLFTLATVFPMLEITGVVASDNNITQDVDGYTLYVHYMIGITCIAIILASTLLGLASRLLILFSAPTNVILLIKFCHKIMGYLTAILCKSNSYVIYGISDNLTGLLCQDIFCMILIIVWKLTFPKL